MGKIGYDPEQNHLRRLTEEEQPNAYLHIKQMKQEGDAHLKIASTILAVSELAVSEVSIQNGEEHLSSYSCLFYFLVLDIYTTPLEILYICVILSILKSLDSLDMRIKLMNNTVHSWPLQEAKNRLSQLVVSAQQGKPQYITKRGQEAAVLISMEEYRRVHQPAQPFNEFLIAAPLVDDIETKRMPASLRDIEL